MARDFSKVSPKIWGSRKFAALETDELRLLYLYLLTSPHSNSAGCYTLKMGYGCADLNWPNEQYEKSIDTLCKGALIAFDYEAQTVLIANWVGFNKPMNAKHALGILKDLEAVSSVPLQTIRFWEYATVLREKGLDKDSALGARIHALSVLFPKPSEGVDEGLPSPLEGKIEILPKPQIVPQSVPQLDKESESNAPTYLPTKPRARENREDDVTDNSNFPEPVPRSLKPDRSRASSRSRVQSPPPSDYLLQTQTMRRATPKKVDQFERLGTQLAHTLAAQDTAAPAGSEELEGVLEENEHTADGGAT